MMLYVLIALQVLDLLSTVIALRNPKLGEGNGVLKPLFDRFGALPVLLVGKSAFIALLLYWNSQIAIEAVYLLCAVYGYVVVNNIKLIRGNYGE